MADVVFVLGAGCSKRAGAPLMADFLDVARDLRATGRSEPVDSDFDRVFAGIAKLQSVHSKARLDIHNIESVFGAFEMATTLARFGDYSEEETKALGASARTLIAKTIEQTLRFPVQEQIPGVPPPYPAFADLVKKLKESARPRRSIAVITFNYDIASDFALERGGLHVDYGLPSGPSTGVPLLKLHGSLNWRQCSQCDIILAKSVNQFMYEAVPWFLEGQQDVAVGLGAGSMRLKHHDRDVRDTPVLVPPTWNKTEYHRTLSTVWARAAKELSAAQDIYLLGYSLPLTDSFFRYLYALGTVGDTPLRRFWVFNPDRSVESRFRELLGPGAEERFQLIEQNFDIAIKTIRASYNLG